MYADITEALLIKFGNLANNFNKMKSSYKNNVIILSHTAKQKKKEIKQDTQIETDWLRYVYTKCHMTEFCLIKNNFPDSLLQL